MRYRRKKKPCPFKSGEVKPDYKDIRRLKDYVMESGRMVPSRISGVTASAQRKLSHEIKISRFLALLPYCDNHK